MKITLTNTMPVERMNALKAGFEKHGDSVTIGSHFDYRADFTVSWGLNRSPVQAAIKNKKNYIIVERGYLGDRLRWSSFGINGLNGYANFNNDNVPNDRWDKYFKGLLKPWILDSHRGDYALIAGQVPFDSALYGIDFWDWVNKAGREAKKYYKNVYFRNHPVYKRQIFTDLPQEEPKMKTPKVVITYSSNYAVDSVIRGVPAVSTIRGSMAWDVTSHTIKEALFKGDREEWCHRLAYTQWLDHEFTNGDAWDHLRPLAKEMCT